MTQNKKEMTMTQNKTFTVTVPACGKCNERPALGRSNGDELICSSCIDDGHYGFGIGPLFLGDVTETVDVVADVEAFHKKYLLAYTGKPRALPVALAEFRRKFLKEELDEYKKATYQAEYDREFIPRNAQGADDMMTTHLAEAMDGLIDLVYVAVGNAHLHGFDFRTGWRLVHAANMTKVRTMRAEDSQRGGVWDVTKPADFKAPDHRPLVADHAHKGE